MRARWSALGAPSRIPAVQWADKTGPQEVDVAAHAKREMTEVLPGHGPTGRLRNGNPSGNPHLAPRCGARTRAGTACRAPAMRNGRCRMHGGASTGARTAEGRQRCAEANWRHGARSRAVAEQRREMRAALYRLQAVRAWCELELERRKPQRRDRRASNIADDLAIASSSQQRHEHVGNPASGTIEPAKFRDPIRITLSCRTQSCWRSRPQSVPAVPRLQPSTGPPRVESSFCSGFVPRASSMERREALHLARIGGSFGLKTEEDADKDVRGPGIWQARRRKPQRLRRLRGGETRRWASMELVSRF